ncbi:MAG: hypothetical protein PUP92_16925 [Rhizonema sp. PD38]|nr:hypothetical protein [Rhizonema sp. PD38]
MEQHSQSHSFFLGNNYTITDIGLFAYVHVAHEGGYNMTQFSAIQVWIEKVKHQPHYKSINQV